ncbi:helix-turn-helix domain-containing protein [Clostridium pasteurianum]|uniref:Putative transcriptional regulator n=1 Tax=Clostridium pasteurianum BC1 TaxID=86416 RepID=R4K8B2_CLOPA|nr:helix-turn-helix transcriptional regulator [Clostridium pasteurianum]AGK96764.1 putative transcriptional regulator [Clostridium pasteurianum BC1]
MIITKLHIRMAEHRLTQSELAKKTGIRQPTISAYCSDNYKMISKEHLDVFCKFFNCKLTDIIDFVDDTNDNKE